MRLIFGIILWRRGRSRFCHFPFTDCRTGRGGLRPCQGRGIRLEEERAGKRAGGPARPESGPPRALEREGPVSGIAVPRAAHNPRCPRVGIR